jgi:hypothetical protein
MSALVALQQPRHEGENHLQAEEDAPRVHIAVAGL